MSFPSPAEGPLLRAMGSYLRAAPKSDLPAKLRPLAGRHQKMLARHKNEILGALDENAALRGLVAEWLDDKPRIRRADADALRLAAARPEGWEEKLAGIATPRATKSPRRAKQTSDRDTVAKANERAKKAKEEARKARSDAERAVGAAERRAERLATQVDELAGRMRSLEKELTAARKEAERARADVQREARKARRKDDTTETALKAARRELEKARREIDRLSESEAPVPKRRTAARTARSPKPPSTRVALRAPKGRLEDAPETLREWLRTDDVQLLIDGYNVSKAKGGFGDLSLETQRRRLIQEVGKLARAAKVPATIVFDGSEVAPGTSRRARAPVAVEYSRPGEIADDHLIAKLSSLPNFPVIVVTNDRELQHRARALGATIARSDQLLGLIR